jgi:hypothetical protein
VVVEAPIVIYDKGYSGVAYCHLINPFSFTDVNKNGYKILPLSMNTSHAMPSKTNCPENGTVCKQLSAMINLFLFYNRFVIMLLTGKHHRINYMDDTVRSFQVCSCNR